MRPPLTNFVLPYTRMPIGDRNAMRTFYESQKGTFDSTWSFTLGAITYSHLVFTDDTFRYQEDAATPTLYSWTLHARQTQNPGVTAGTAGNPFPGLASGSACQLPYVGIRRYAVLLNTNTNCGMQYGYTWIAGGLSGFPTRSLRGWVLSFPAVSDVDTATLETHFRNQYGQFATFTFIDPDDAVSYAKCRYGSDTLDIVNSGPNQNALTLQIMETN